MRQEIIERTILNFHPIRQDVCAREADLGGIEGTHLQVVYGVFPYEMRVSTPWGEPFIGRRTRQPVVALVEEGKLVTTLAYRSDINKLPDGLAEKVAEKLLSPFDVLYEKLWSEPAGLVWEP